jgi:hypothetical protein
LKLLGSKPYYGICSSALFFLVAAASFHGYFAKWHLGEAATQGEYWRVNSFETILDSTADRPYVYRQLLPMVANWIDKRLPNAIKHWLLVSSASGNPTLLSLSSDSALARDRR